MKSFLRIIFRVVFIGVAVGAAFALGRWPVSDWSILATNPSAPSHSNNSSPTAAASHSVNQGAPAPHTYLSPDEARKAWNDIMAGNLPAGAQYQTQALIDLLRQMNPADAAQLAVTLPDGTLRTNALTIVANIWVAVDAKAAFAWASQLPAADAQTELQSMILTNFGTHPDIAKQYVDQLTNPAVRNEALQAVASGLAGKGDPSGALAWVSQRATGAVLQNAVAGIFQTLAAPSDPFSANGNRYNLNPHEQNLTAAVSLLGQITDPAMRATAISTLADGWGKTDLTAALTWAQSLPDSDATARSTALNSLVSTMSQNDPAGAVAFIKNSPDPNAYITLAPSISAILAKYDPQGALAYVQGLPDGATKDKSLGEVLVSMGSTDFTSAWGDATALPNGPAKDVAMEGLVGELAKSDPAQAATLLTQFTPDSEGLRYAIHNLVPTWAKLDPQATSTWLNTSPPGGGIAIVQFIETTAAKDPATALQWANSIKSDTGRINNINRALGKWPAADPAGKLNAIMTANVTEDQRTDLLNKFNDAQSGAK